ncbi:MAG TPA: YCF48-related protein [Burkholderiales bacterium]|nr:YCF48-related protein [Burkholderiales bacterium]
MRYLRVLFVLVLTLGADVASAHDPSAYGGLFRSRNLGQSWLNADIGLFLGAAVSVSIDPTDPNHLLLGTDSGLLVSVNGGRKWDRVAPAKLFGAVFAVAFLPDGKSALCATPGGVYRLEGSVWQQASAPTEAAPARAIAFGAAPGRVYLLGRRDLYRSDDGGRNFLKVEHDLPDEPQITELAVSLASEEVIVAVADGRPMSSRDGGRTWQLRSAGLPQSPAEGLTLDPAADGRVWIASASRIYRSDDAGASWHPVGERLPEADTSVRGIVADRDGAVIVVTTHRGVYRSADAGRTWALLEDNLPVHLEARPLLRDPSSAETLYAGYSLIPYGELWRTALEGGNLLNRVDLLSLAGGLAFLVLLGLLGVLGARWLFRRSAGAA